MSRHRTLLEMARAAALAAPLLLSACASAPPALAPPALFDDAQFRPAQEPLDPASVFALDDEMRSYLERHIAPAARADGVRQALTEQLYIRSKLQLEYESTVTRNAAEAFGARKGNCLSLVIMTGAFAKAMGLQVSYQQVTIDEMYSRAGDMYFMSGHVNLTLGRRPSDVAGYDRFGTFTVDFLSPNDLLGQKTVPISENTVIAMFMNNRAAEAMVAGQLDDAYWRAREAIALDPGFLSAYNTLGVIYLRHGDAAGAERALRYVLERQPDNPRVLANHVDVLRRMGREADAEREQARLATLEPYPPFYFYSRGELAMKQGDLRAAREWFKRELDRSPDYHEFHYALAAADFGLGLVEEARKELAIALQDATQRSDRELYAVKLDKLKAYRERTIVPIPPVRVQ